MLFKKKILQWGTSISYERKDGMIGMARKVQRFSGYIHSSIVEFRRSVERFTCATGAQQAAETSIRAPLARLIVPREAPVERFERVLECPSS